MPSLKNPIKNDKSLHFFLSQKTPSPSKSKIQSKKGSISTTPDRVSFDHSPNNPNLGPFLLKLARDSIREDLDKALEYALRASIWFERNSGSGLDLAVSLHVVAAVYCGLGRFEDAVPVLKKAIEVVDAGSGSDHAMAKFSGFMQLGDAYFMLGQLDRSISCYESGLRIQIECLRDSDIRVAETCRYLAEAYIQAMQFDEAEKLCSRTLEIHREHNEPASLEEAADRRLLAFVCEAKGDYESALDHLVLASVAMNAAGLENDVAAIDVSIGNTYVSLGRFDEAIFSYQKALTVFKSTKGDGHPSAATAFIRLADVYYKTGKLRESKSYCENALRIYANPAPGITSRELAVGLTELAVIYEGLNEPEEALKLLDKAMKILEHTPGQQSTVAGIEAQMGVMFYMIGRFKEARNSYENAIAKLRGTGENRSAFFGILLNQMGLASVQLYKIDEATELFEGARGILEQECGPFHPDTLGVYSNLAATYDALGRMEDAIELLEYILKVRQEKLGTANPDVDDEKKRLAELRKEAGRAWNPKAESLKNLLGSKPRTTSKNTAERRPGFGFRS